MHPSAVARTHPDKPAYVIATTGAQTTYGELDAISNKGAQLFAALGLHKGDVVALMVENVAAFYEIVWAAQRSGLRYTAISTRLLPGEVAYIVQDCAATVFIASHSLRHVAAAATENLPTVNLLLCDGASPPFHSFEAAREVYPETPVDCETPGGPMLYSSGTTGRPKGVRRPLPGGPLVALDPLLEKARGAYGMGPETVYLSPAPLYHAAPLAWSMAVQRLGGTVIVMDAFDPENVLRLIERYGVTHAQFVPTHFIRLLKLPPEIRDRYRLGTLKVVFHAAAPCPIPIKERMMEWWGPIIHEYYGGTEGNGMTMIDPQEWLSHRGSVGRPVGAGIQICDENGEPLPPLSEGLVYFSGGGKFEYHNAPEKTAESTNAHGWTTLGDVGRLDEDGYLYLTDRKSFMIISGGVNIYPQEIENLLVTHPKVADAAVVGAPDEEMGERVVAVIQPVAWDGDNEALRMELMAYARQNLSRVKAPREINFTRELPRQPNGKLYKRLIRDAYWRRAGDMAETPQPLAGDL